MTHKKLDRRLEFALVRIVLLLLLSVALSAQNPLPLIYQPLVPNSVKPGTAGFMLTVNGNGFVAGATVRWNGSPRLTTFVNHSRLTAVILPADIATPRTAAVSVINPSPGGGTSNIAYFEVTTPSSLLGLRFLEFGGGDTAIGVAVGDFNADRKLDIVEAECGSNSVHVLLGTGTGTFQTPANYHVGTCPVSVVVADFNRDGRPDLAVANTYSGNVSVLLGTGAGVFATSVNYTVDGGPRSIAMGDLNGDGKWDLAVANESGTVSVLFGNGDGTFQAKMDLAFSIGPTSVAIGDFNRDDKQDLAVALGNGDGTGAEVAILLGNGNGTFQPPVDYSTGQGPFFVATADVNADGKLDLLVANAYGSSVGVLLGNGNGSFQADVNYSTGSSPVSVALADFNGDGKLDLVVANQDSNNVSLLLGNGNGTFQAAVSYAVGTSPQSVSVGDFNGDGRLDIAIPDYGSGAASVLLQTPVVSLLKIGLKFSNRLIGASSASQIVSLSNPSGLTLKINSIGIAGTNASDFSQSNTCGPSVPPKGSCTISIVFKPTHLGPRAASVTISDNAANTPQSIALTGTGLISGPNGTLSTSTVTFATQLVGTTSTKQFVTLNNYGTLTLSLNSVTIGGVNPADFGQSNDCGLSITSGASCTLSISFKPNVRGLRSAILTLTDNASPNTRIVNLAGTGTVVKLVPSSLSFSCHLQPNNCPPPAQTVTVTNTGNTLLSITGIAISGQNFSQTNQCPSSLSASASCTITVKFTPRFFGTSSGAVSISDNGGGSPQQVPLSGKETKRGMTPEAQSALGIMPATSAPKPSGHSPVGSRISELLSTSTDPFLNDGTKRKLLVRFWYPAAISQGCEPAEYTSPAVWNYFSQLVKAPLPYVTTNSCLNAPVTDGLHPVVVFTHGYTGTFTDYTFLFEELASRGYIVASVDHPYESTAVEFPDGEFVKSRFGSHLAENTWRRDDRALSFALSVRLTDLKFFASELDRLNSQVAGAFEGKLDMNRIAIVGHSLGGVAALLTAEKDPRFKAAVVVDSSIPETIVGQTQTPVLILAMGRQYWGETDCHLWTSLRGVRVAVNIRGTEHVTPSDAVWLARGAVKTGTMGPERTIAAVRDSITAFLDVYVRNKALEPLFGRGLSRYSDAVVFRQDQTLCNQSSRP